MEVNDDQINDSPPRPTINRALVQFCNEKGDSLCSQLELPLGVDVRNLQALYDALIGQQEDSQPQLFYLDDVQIQGPLSQVLATHFADRDTERVLQVICLPQASYRVQSVTRCSSSIPGHSDAVLCTAFNSSGQFLASGGGDTTVRFWDTQTQTPLHCCRSHKNWVLVIAWAPNGLRLASACRDGKICIWDPATGKQVGRTLSAHSKWITALSWEPLHSNPECRLLASASKDTTIRIWDTMLGQVLFALNSHTMSVTCVKWGGNGLIYSSSQDRTIKIWRASNGTLQQTLAQHAHWVNTLTLSTDYAMRLASFDPENQDKKSNEQTLEEQKAVALRQYQAAYGEGERLVSASDDFTLILWLPETNNRPIARLTGHQQLVNDVRFSPNGRLLASASFDKSIKLWNGKTGNFIATLRGHVNRVYQLSWSSDSRLLVSASADSTLKVWNAAKQKLWIDLPGHEDEVFAVDWSPTGDCVASGGKDKMLKLWQK